MKTRSKDDTPLIQEVPAYGITEAARYLKMPAATLRSWTVGRSYPRVGQKGFFEPLIMLAATESKHLSFENLVEAHVLKALRTEHGVPVRAVRTAIQYAENELGVKHLLRRRNLLGTHDRELFLRQYGKLINLSRSGQYALDRMLEAHLRRVDWKADVPLRLYPFLAEEPDGRKTIVIDPDISFGRPVIVRRGVTTAIIAQRMDAGETVADLAADYELTSEEIDAAIVYERAA